jgi:hypothetical protein
MSFGMFWLTQNNSRKEHGGKYVNHHRTPDWKPRTERIHIYIYEEEYFSAVGQDSELAVLSEWHASALPIHMPFTEISQTAYMLCAGRKIVVSVVRPFTWD